MVKRWGQARYRQWLNNNEHLSADLPTRSPAPNVTANLVPVVYITLIAGSKVKELNAQILTFLGYPSEGIARVTTTRVIRALSMHGARLLIIDDAHMLKASSVAGREVLDYLKFLNTELGELGGTLVLVGAHLTSGPILTDLQIEGRLRKLTFTPYSIDTRTGQGEWQAFLKGAEALLLRYLPNAASGAIANVHAAYVWKRTQGYIGDTARLLTEATFLTLKDGSKAITRCHLDAVALSARAEQGETEWHRRTQPKAAAGAG